MCCISLFPWNADSCKFSILRNNSNNKELLLFSSRVIFFIECKCQFSLYYTVKLIHDAKGAYENNSTSRVIHIQVYSSTKTIIMSRSTFPNRVIFKTG